MGTGRRDIYEWMTLAVDWREGFGPLEDDSGCELAVDWLEEHGPVEDYSGYGLLGGMWTRKRHPSWIFHTIATTMFEEKNVLFSQSAVSCSISLWRQ